MKNSSVLSLALVLTSLMLGACEPKGDPWPTTDAYLIREVEEDYRSSFQELQEFMVATYPNPSKARDEGYLFPPHGSHVVAGCGFTLSRRLTLEKMPLGVVYDLGSPTLLFYDSNHPTDGELIGWAYAYDYVPGRTPRMAGVPEDAWFVHEAGAHNLFTGDMTLTPPVEDYPGQRDSTKRYLPGWHARAWDLHMWVNPYLGTTWDSTAVERYHDTPVMSINEPFCHLCSVDDMLTLPDGTFFYPGASD